MNLIKNLAINLRVTSNAAIFITWMVCMTLLGIFGKGALADRAITQFGIVSIIVMAALTLPPPRDEAGKQQD